MFLSKCQKMNIILLTRYFWFSTREAFLSSGNLSAYQSVSENMSHALPLMSDSVMGGAGSLPVPEPLEPAGLQVRNHQTHPAYMCLRSQDAPLESGWWISMSLVFHLWFQAKKWYPWRSFIAIHGSHPLIIWDVSPIEHYMQVCCFMNTFLSLPLPHVMSCVCSSASVIWTTAVEWRLMERFWVYLWSLMMWCVVEEMQRRSRPQETPTSAQHLIEK